MSTTLNEQLAAAVAEPNEHAENKERPSLPRNIEARFKARRVQDGGDHKGADSRMRGEAP